MRKLIYIGFVLVHTLLQAQSFGYTDPSFGANGKVSIDLNGYSDGFHTMAIQADGKILAAGFSYNGQGNQLTLVRFNSNGSVDNSFQQDANIAQILGIAECVAEDITLMADGRILVTAQLTDNGTSQVMVARFHTNGILDLSFGSNGVVIVSYPGANIKPVAVSNIENEMILVAGNIAIAGQQGYFFYRMQYDGSIDRALGMDGFATYFTTGIEVSITGMSLYANGKMLVSGSKLNGNISSGFMSRHLVNGSMDNSFGYNGTSILDYCSNSHNFTNHVIDFNGNILVTGSTQQGSTRKVLAASFDNQGMANSSFGNQGWIDHMAGAGLAYGQDIKLGPQGIIYIAGHAFNGQNNDMLLMALESDGSICTQIGANGYITVALNNNHDYAKAMAIQADGQILLAGMTDNGLNFDLALVRLTGLVSSVGINQNSNSAAANAWYNGSSIQLDLTSNARVMVLDLSGRVCFDQILSSGNNSIQFSSTPGVHILNVISGQDMQSQKIMIQ